MSPQEVESAVATRAVDMARQTIVPDGNVPLGVAGAIVLSIPLWALIVGAVVVLLG
jgi:hypothetical protein